MMLQNGSLRTDEWWMNRMVDTREFDGICSKDVKGLSDEKLELLRQRIEATL